MLLRSMRQAIYQADNIGHFGLALKSYAHFTSPIRRYPDLILHRAIKYQTAKEQQGNLRHKWTPSGGYHYQLDEVDPMGEHCSMTERRADDATRDVADWLKCEYMLDHVGDEFDVASSPASPASASSCAWPRSTSTVWCTSAPHQRLLPVRPAAPATDRRELPPSLPPG